MPNVKHLSQLGMDIKTDHSLAPYTYFKIGGPADYFATAANRQELVELIRAAMRDEISYLVIGSGSNLLFSDKGFRGLVIRNVSGDILIDSDNSRITADSGVIVNLLVNTAISNGLAGMEDFLGIPGTVGGAIFNNSHHLDLLIGNFVETVDVMDQEGRLRKLNQAECHFAYDYSIFHKTGETILSAVFRLKPGDPAELAERAQKAVKRRRDTQPLEYPSSGCMFKNIGETNAVKYKIPEGTTAAGALIDKAGCKGMKVGGAEVSHIHANFIINTGNATAQDVWMLSQKVKEKVRDEFGVDLEREVFIFPEKIDRRTS